MDNFGEQHCRLCLGTISDEHFKEIKDDMKSILDILLLKLNLDNRSKYIMCNICSRRVMEAFRFKSMCLYTYNTIIPYVYGETECSVDLKQIYIKERGREDLISTLGDYKVCRYCMQLVKNKFIPAHEMAGDMVQIYIPEINLTVVEDPVICNDCFDSFVSHSNFIMNCLEVNKKIKNLCDTEVVEDSVWMPTVDSYIKTEEMDIKSENGKEDEWLETDSIVAKSEYEEILNKSHHSNIKTEDKDEDEKSEAAYLTDSKWVNSVNQYNSSQENKYSATDHASNLSRYLISHKDTDNVCVFQRDTWDYSCKKNYSLNSDRKVFECDKCRYKTNFKKCLKKHQLKHKEISETEVFECEVCDYKTNRKVYLKKHLVRHKDFTETEVFACDICSYKTKYKKHHKRHLLSHKDISETEVFECDTCDFKTKRRDSLRRHLLTHKDIFETRAFKCDTCDFKTKRMDKLRRHLLIHKDISETEAFKCDICDYKTKYKYSLKQHQLTHKDISETEVTKCDKCDFKTKYRNNLKGHQLKHKDISEMEVYACDTCDYKTKRKRNLKDHQLTHKDISETEVFECDTCDFKTKIKTNLKRHQLNHKDISETKVFKCDTCDYKSNQQSNLRRHLVTHKDISEMEFQCDVVVKQS